MKQLAWLSARPRDEGDKAEPNKVPPSRLEAMKASGIEPALPPLSPFLFDDPDMPVGHPVMVDWLFDLGPTMAGATGEAVISWQELGAWEAGTGVPLEPWQRSLLRRLSRDWLNQSFEARKADCFAPYETRETIEANRGSVGAGLRRALGGRPARRQQN